MGNPKYHVSVQIFKEKDDCIYGDDVLDILDITAIFSARPNIGDTMNIDHLISSHDKFKGEIDESRLEKALEEIGRSIFDRVKVHSVHICPITPEEYVDFEVKAYLIDSK